MERNYSHEMNIGVEADFDLMLQKVQMDDSGKPVLDEHGCNIPVGSLRHAYTGGNLITNTGMNLLASESFSPNSFHRQWGRRLNVGGGTTEPLPTDTALTNKIADSGTRSEDTNYSLTWGTGADAGKLVFTVNFTFGVGVAAGNITEVGLDYGTALQTHALLKDGSGNPVVVNVAADEQLVCVYRTKFQPSTADVVYSTTTSPTPVAYTLTMRPANVGAGSIFESGTSVINVSSGGLYAYTGSSSGIGAVGGEPTGTRSSAIQTYQRATGDAYVNNSFEKINHFTLQPTDANLADIGAFMFYGSLFSWQIGIVPRLTKVNPETIKFSIKTKWNRL